MAIDLTVQYPGKIGAATPAYPYGEPRNVTVPDDGTGTPWEQAIAKETEGFKQALLSSAGITPSGTPDAVAASQYLQALVEQVAGRAITYIATGTGDAIVLSPGVNQEPIQSLFVGLIVEFIAIANNTLASVTVNVAGLGVVSLLNNQGGTFLPNQFIAGQHYKIRYDGTNFIIDELTYYTLDTPISLLSTLNPAIINTAISNITLDNVKATRVNVGGHLRVETFFGEVGAIEVDVFVASSNKTIVSNELYRVLRQRVTKEDLTTGTRFFNYDTNDFNVNLDSSFDFWYIADIENLFASSATRELIFVLKGYWA